MVEGFHCLSKLTHGLAPSFAVWQSKGSRLGMPASVASRLSSSYVYCSTLKGKSSGYLSTGK